MGCLFESGVLLVLYSYSFMIQSTIFTGPCQSGFVFQVDGTLMPPDRPDLWPDSNSKHQWLIFYRINEISLQGGGLIDGRGKKWGDLPCKPHKGANRTTLSGPCYSPIIGNGWNIVRGASKDYILNFWIYFVIGFCYEFASLEGFLELHV